MQIKKNPKANLENYSKMFIQLGLVLALLVVYLAIQKKTYDRQIGSLADVSVNMQDEEANIEIQKIKPPEIKTPPPPTPDKIEVVDDKKDVEETVIEATDVNENDAVDVQDIQDVSDEEDVVEDVPFAIIEDVPVYPGCKGNKKKLRACLQSKISKLINRKFNADLASDLGLSPGVKRIFVMFKIDKTGKVVDIRARAPHKRLQAEAIRVIKLIPRMIPGKQRGKAVGVKYSLPIAFKVE